MSHLGSGRERHLLPFYIYDTAAFDFTAVLECYPGWQYSDQAAEVSMLQLLQEHPQRVLHPSDATIFVIPIFPYVSLLAGMCAGRTHEKRMLAAAAALSRSAWHHRHHGWDHLLITNTFRISAFRALRGLLSNSTVAWFESPAAPRRGPGRLASSAFWRCTLVVPYLASPFCHQQRSSRPLHPCMTFHKRNASVFFHGSFKASPVRRHFAILKGLPGADIVDVQRSKNMSQPSGGCDQSQPCASKLETARGMLCADYCLVPKGDTPTSSRFFQAIACGCVPLVISDFLSHHLPYRQQVGRTRPIPTPTRRDTRAPSTHGAAESGSCAGSRKVGWRP